MRISDWSSDVCSSDLRGTRPTLQTNDHGGGDRPMTSAKSPKDVMAMIQENDVKYVDFRFTDPRGKWQHTAQHVSTIEEDTLQAGVTFDRSWIAGWKATNESDMILIPEAGAAGMEPFAYHPQPLGFGAIAQTPGHATDQE